ATLELFACCLACLAANHFVAVLDAFALVGIGLAERADLGRGLPHLLLVDTGDGDVARLGVDDDVDAFRNGETHRVRVAELEDDFPPLHLGAVADADDVELALERFADALDVVRHERAHEAAESAGLPFLVTAGEGDDVVLDLHADPGDDGRHERALGTLHHHSAALEACFHALRQRNLFLANTRHRISPYQTWQRTSPPTPLLTASEPESTPLEVETMARPRPPSTRGISCLLR